MRLHFRFLFMIFLLLPGCSRDWDEPLLIAYDDGTNIFIMDENGGNIRQVAAGTNPLFSPDGMHLVYWRANSFYILNLESGVERLLTTADAYRASTWSPDGSRVAFINAGYIYTVNTSGGVPVQISAANINQVPLTWSADSAIIACSNSALTQINYYSVSAAPSAPVFTYPVPAGVFGLSFSPGYKIAYTDGASFYIAAVDFSSSGIVSSTAMDKVPSWSPDGERLVYEFNSNYIRIIDPGNVITREIAGPGCHNPCFQGKPH